MKQEKDLTNCDFLSLSDEGKRQACRQLFFESTHRKGNRKEQGTGSIIPWDVEELYEYSKEHRISNQEIERIFKEVK